MMPQPAVGPKRNVSSFTFGMAVTNPIGGPKTNCFFWCLYPAFSPLQRRFSNNNFVRFVLFPLSLRRETTRGNSPWRPWERSHCTSINISLSSFFERQKRRHPHPTAETNEKRSSWWDGYRQGVSETYATVRKNRANTERPQNKPDTVVWRNRLRNGIDIRSCCTIIITTDKRAKSNGRAL